MMEPSSGNRRTPTLKTYSRRVNHKSEEVSTKRKRSEDDNIVLPTLSKIQPKRGTIQSYFTPLPTPPTSSPSTLQTSARSSNLRDRPLNSSPSPQKIRSPPSQPDPQKRVKRRLTTKLRDIPKKSSDDLKFDAKLARRSSSSPMVTKEQTHLDLGQQTNVECPQCHMMFNKTVEADRKAHDKYHNQEFGMRKLVLSGGDPFLSILTENRHLYQIIEVDQNSSARMKAAFLRLYQGSMDIMDGEHLSEDEIFKGTKKFTEKEAAGKGTRSKHHIMVRKYKIHMLLIHENPVSFLITERINQSRAYNMDTREYGKTYNAFMCVDRIFTLPEYKGRGAAKSLIDAARNSFHPARELRIEEIAFTFPSIEGRRLAGSYFKEFFEHEDVKRDKFPPGSSILMPIESTAVPQAPPISGDRTES